jgi:hypothetical protein
MVHLWAPSPCAQGWNASWLLPNVEASRQILVPPSSCSIFQVPPVEEISVQRWAPSPCAQADVPKWGQYVLATITALYATKLIPMLAFAPRALVEPDGSASRIDAILNIQAV